MRKKTIIFALSAVCVFLISVGNTFAQSREFKFPQVRGVHLNFCKHNGRQCGKPAADLFCREMRYSRAVFFTPDTRMGARGIQTLIFGDGMLCNGPHCQGFASIVCIRDEVFKTPVPKKPETPKEPEPTPEKKAEPKPKKPENKKAGKKKDKKTRETAKRKRKNKPEIRATKISPNKFVIPKRVPIPVFRPNTELAVSNKNKQLSILHCAVLVRESENEDVVEPTTVTICPGTLKLTGVGMLGAPPISGPFRPLVIRPGLLKITGVGVLGPSVVEGEFKPLTIRPGLLKITGVGVLGPSVVEGEFKPLIIRTRPLVMTGTAE